MTVLNARLLKPPRLRFDPAVPSRVHQRAYQGLVLHGPYDSSSVQLRDRSVLFVFPEQLKPSARHLLKALRDGYKGFPGFERMFRVPLRNEQVDSLPIEADLKSPDGVGSSYRTQISSWSGESRASDPVLALVLVPHSEPWETNRPYYEAKAAFARLGVPTQMVTAELLASEREFAWSVANIALASFAKLGGIPWAVDVPQGESDLLIGVGRADIRRPGGLTHIFGYAVSFASNGVYRHTWSFTPTADENTYAERLEEALVGALQAGAEDEPFARLVIHLGRRTGRREIEAVRGAMERSKVSLPAAFIRLDNSTLYDISDGLENTLAPPKGLAVRLGPRRLLLQTEGLTPVGVPDGPLLVELDRRSDVDAGALDDLAAQTFRLAHANWRGFNARSHPVTLAYGELLARLVGYLEEVTTWDPTLLRSELRDRPWFL